jgi:hypothetical protein
VRDCGHNDIQMEDHGSLGGHGGNAPQGQSLCPDQRRRPYMPDVICAACKQRGHSALSWDMLAIALFVERRKNQLLESKKSKIEETWIA